jgi:hypothetical protein
MSSKNSVHIHWNNIKCTLFQQHLFLQYYANLYILISPCIVWEDSHLWFILRAMIQSPVIIVGSSKCLTVSCFVEQNHSHLACYILIGKTYNNFVFLAVLGFELRPSGLRGKYSMLDPWLQSFLLWLFGDRVLLYA